jgi:hypothetical protein
MIGVLGFDSRRGLGIFLYTTTSRTALRPTQPPIQWVPGALSLGVKRPGHEADHSPPSSADVKEWVELYLHSPNTPSWRGAQLKEAQGQLHLHILTEKCVPENLINCISEFRIRHRGFESRQGLGVLLLTTASRPTLGSTQPPIQWVPGALQLE